MIVTAHCFAYGAKINPHTVQFKFKEFNASLTFSKISDGEGLTLEITKKIDISEVISPPKEEMEKDKNGDFVRKRLLPYKQALTEASQLVEGLLALHFNFAPPKFDAEHIFVNVLAETPDEETKKKSGEISGGFGHVLQPEMKPEFTISEKIFSSVEESVNHLPALSFLAQGARSAAQNDHEVAFFLFFRVIEGYFSDGSKQVKDALLEKSEELKKYIKYDEQVREAVQNILKILKLPSKSETNFEGFLSDLVLIRHKLTHFSATNQERHSNAAIKPHLTVLNYFLRISCTLILREKAGIDAPRTS